MAHGLDPRLLRRPRRRRTELKSAYTALTLALLLCALAACSSAPPNDSISPSPALSAADQDFIASRHGGM